MLLLANHLMKSLELLLVLLVTHLQLPTLQGMLFMLPLMLPL
jgi:hypothetical protein